MTKAEDFFSVHSQHLKKLVQFKMIFLFFIALNIFECTSKESCYYDGNDFCVSQDDILSVDLLPGTFLLDSYQNDEEIEREEAPQNITVGGTYEEALNEMDYHRKRMNEYLCHGFMAEEIFREVKSIRVKRLQDSSSMNSLPDFLGDVNVTVHDKLLSDEGSSKYKEWLQRTTTLDDVYRHMMPKQKITKKIGKYGHLHDFTEFDGEVTGYAVPAPVAPDKTGYYYDDMEEMVSSPTGHHSYSHHHPPSHHHGEVVPIIHEEHYYHESDHEEEPWHEVSHSKGKGELTIKDFFEIALTALAFLAFGLFLIQLLMAITNSATTAAVITEEPARFKRNVIPSKFGYRSNAELNELSHRVLRSIEAAMVAPYDSGRCLKWTLCNDNQYSKNTQTAQRIWIPVWSIGMSWLAGRMGKQASWHVMLDTIKASAFGLGGANCSDIYPGCNLVKERRKRRRRRR